MTAARYKLCKHVLFTILCLTVENNIQPCIGKVGILDNTRTWCTVFIRYDHHHCVFALFIISLSNTLKIFRIFSLSLSPSNSIVDPLSHAQCNEQYG